MFASLPWFNSSVSTFENLVDARLLDLLEILKQLEASDLALNLPPTPQLVVVGSQSSGKSTVINRLLGYPILPTGSAMTTKIPVKITMIQEATASARLEAGHFTHQWIPSQSWSLPLSEPDQTQIRDQINQSQNRDPQDRPMTLHFRLVGPKVSNNLTLIDVPGLIQMDKKEAQNLKQAIEKVVGQFLAQPGAIILAVCPARDDLEVDPALAFIQQNYDPGFNRTLGILTKVDKVQNWQTLQPYLEGTCDPALQLGWGYYLLRNPVRPQDCQDAYEAEERKLLSPFKKPQRCGITSLRQGVCQIMKQRLEALLPGLHEKVDAEILRTSQLLLKLNGGLPPTTLTPAQTVLKTQQMFHAVARSCEDHYDLVIGNQIKTLFENWREQIDGLNPFREIKSDFVTSVQNKFEGNHMTSTASNLKILERVFKTSDPHRQVRELTGTLLNNLQDLLGQDFESIVAEYHQPAFVRFVRHHFQQEFSRLQQQTLQRVKEAIEEEQNYIWTDNPAFRQTLDTDPIETLLVTFYDLSRDQLKHQIPHIIMARQVDALARCLGSVLINQHQEANQPHLLTESSETAVQRQNLVNRLELLKSMTTLF